MTVDPRRMRAAVAASPIGPPLKQARRTAREYLSRIAVGKVAGLPLPPPNLIFAVIGDRDAAGYAVTGNMMASDITAALAHNGLAIDQFEKILDFGCGSGRVIRHWRRAPGEVHGTDYNQELISWCRTHLPFAFAVNGLDPPTRYRDGEFDFVYALSVFTHLDGRRHELWRDELHRIIRPGGYLLLTTHGARFISLTDQLGPQQREALDRGELVVLAEAAAGTNGCTSFHPEAFVRDRLSQGFTVVDWLPWAATGLGGQDIWLLRRDD
jgi:SAM-dependent methyltransferase